MAEVGDVTATLRLDLKHFKANIESAKSQAEGLKTSLQSGIGKGFAEDLKASLESVSAQLEKLASESKSLNSINTSLSNMNEQLSLVSSSLEKTVAGSEELSAVSTSFKQASIDVASLNGQLTQMSNNIRKTKQFSPDQELSYADDIANMKLQFESLVAQMSVFKEESIITGESFNLWTQQLKEVKVLIDTVEAQLARTPQTTPLNLEDEIINVRNALNILREEGMSATLQLEEGFFEVDNSLIRTEEDVELLLNQMLQFGDEGSGAFVSMSRQLSQIISELADTKEFSQMLIDTLHGIGDSTGIFALLNGQVRELNESLVATDESTKKTMMNLRTYSPESLIAYRNALEIVKQKVNEVRLANERLFKDNLAMDIEGFNNVNAFNSNLEAIERTKTQIKELIAYTKELGMTPLGNLNGELVSLDENLFQSGMRAESLNEILKTMSSPQLATLNEELGVTQSKLSGATADARLFKETLATMNIGAFNNVKTNFVSPENASIERTLSLIRQLQESYAQLGISSSVAFTDAEGKIVSFDGKLLQSREGLLILKEELSQLNASSLANLEMSLNRLNTRTKTLCDSTALYIDMLGNVKLNNIGIGKGDTANLKNMKQDIENVGKSSENTRKNLEGQKKSVNALDTAYGILRRTLSLVVVMFGFQLAMELFNVGKEAMDASYKIKTLGKEMGWTAQQSQKFQNQANRLQKIYPKIDMNSTAKSVAEMARVYDMTNDEATKFIETAGVFNSAMVKEGRSTEDASLALKDYLDLGQGWNRRMQEIGATKEQLVATGYWDGETQDINAQIKALDAYLKKRHYYQMAKEIYTLDEAYQALQLRLGMFIGQGLQALTPYIISAVKGFLGLLDAIEGVGNALKGNPIFEAVTMFLGIAVSVGILSKGLTMLKVKLAETAVSFLRVFTLNPYLVAIAIAIAGIVTIVYELGKAFGWWKDIPSMIDKITQSLGTLQGQLVAVGTAIAGVAFYFVAKGWVTSSNTIVKAIQKVIDKLGQYIKKNKEADASDLPTGGKGKTPDLPDTKDVGWSDVGKSLRQIGLQAIKAGAYIAVGMALMAEAIILIQLPMRALASTGDYFKSDEANIRKGIDGLKLVAPTILAFAVPVTAIMIAMGYFENAFKISLGSIIKSAVAITAGMALISWAIGLLVAPMLALAVVGGATAILKGAVQEGIKGINLISEAIMALVPVVPMFAVAITAGAIIMATAEVTFGVAVVALATGMALVAVAIGTLVLPLGAIAGLGALPIDMEGVKKGAEAIKQVSIALQYLSDAMNSVASIVVADLAMKIVNLFGNQDWTGLAGSMKKVEEATDSIQTVAKTLGNLSVPDINQEEIKKLGQVAEATKNIKSALDSISGIMNQGNIGGETRIKFGLDGISVFKVDILTELKAKMGDITNFINAFNAIKVPAFGGNYTDKINRIKQVVEAVKQITNALKGIGDIGTSGGIAGGLSWVIWGDLASKYGILFQNIKSTVTFVRRVSQEIQTDNINGESINRLKNVISHIPYIVNTMNTVRTALNPVKDDAGVRDKFDIIKNNIIVVVNRVRDLLASVGDTSSINADSISRINNITQGVVNIVNKVKELRTALGGDDEGTDVNIGKKLGNIFLTLQYVQNFINAIMWNFGANGGATGDISTVLSTFSNALSQITGIASKVNALNTTLPEPNNDIQLQQKLYRLLQNIMVIKRFMSQVNWNVSKDGGVKGTGATEGMTSMVNALSTAINNLAKTCDGAVKTLKGKGEAMGNAISNGFKGKVNDAKSAVSGLQKTIGSMASYACNRADDMSVHFNTTATRIRGVAVQVQNVIDKLNSLPSSKDVNVNVNYHTNGGGFRAGFNLPTFGLGLAGIHNTVSSGFGGVIRGIRGLKGVKTLSAPISGNFVDAFKSIIGGMRYSHYYGTKNNGNVTDTLNSGESNCVDGALATLQLARMFGLDGKLGTTMVNGEGHAFAIIEGKIFDATAMQLLGRTKAPNVRYSASNPTQKDKKKESKKEINIIVDMTDSTFYGDEDFEKKAEKLFNRLALELLDVDKNDGV